MTAQAGGTTSLSLSKAIVRREARARRAAVRAFQRRAAAERAAAHLARACRARGARHVAVYLSMADELDSAPLIRRLRAAGCTLYAPRLAPGRRIRFVALGGALTRNRYGIREPAAGAPPPRLDVIVLPLVAFDAAGHRLGMGGGYYDRLLEGYGPQRPLRVGYAYALQEVADVPVAPHDAPLHAVATERGVRFFPSGD